MRKPTYVFQWLDFPLIASFILPLLKLRLNEYFFPQNIRWHTVACNTVNRPTVGVNIKQARRRSDDLSKWNAGCRRPSFIGRTLPLAICCGQELSCESIVYERHQVISLAPAAAASEHNATFDLRPDAKGSTNQPIGTADCRKGSHRRHTRISRIMRLMDQLPPPVTRLPEFFRPPPPPWAAKC